MDKYFEMYVDAVLTFKRTSCNELVPVPEPNAVQSLCKLLEVFATPDNGVQLLQDRESFNNICRLWFLFWLVKLNQNHNYNFNSLLPIK